MREDRGEGRRGLSRRQFLTIAGAAAALGAVVFAASRSKAGQRLLKPAQPSQPHQAQEPYVRVASQVTTTSWLSKLFRGKL